MIIKIFKIKFNKLKLIIVINMKDDEDRLYTRLYKE